MDAQRVPPPGESAYQEFIRSATMSAGVYRLRAGAADPQRPHTEDELYYVIAGRGRFTSGRDAVDVEAGVCLFVPAGEPHRFHDITEDITVLVVFSPAETG